MAFSSSSSPRKAMPLNDSDSERATRSSTPSGLVTKRAFFCGVVVETDLDGKDITRDVRDIVASLGEPVSSEPMKPLGQSASEPTIASSSSSESLAPGPLPRKRALTNSSALSEVINEFVTTERSYVKRLRVLKEAYADPLRKYAKSKDTAILQPWDANTLFGNIDQLLPVNEAFLTDLEKMIGPNGPKVVGGIGDVTLKHFKDSKGFDLYKHYYAKRDDAQRIFQREMLKKSSTGFAGYIERIKDTTMDNKNRVGLRELLMDPVQRIPRYTMLFRLMIKHMPPSDPQRAKLQEAEALASKIALCEASDTTKNMAVLLSLPRTIEGCPADIVSQSRRLVDVIDVTDVPLPSNGAGEPLPPLHCSLFLFDDKIMLLRRPSPHSSGRSLAGLDELEKATKLGTLPNPSTLKKSGLACKGVFDVAEVVFTDVGGPNIHMYLEVPPNDTSDARWSGRQFRSLTVVTHTPGGASLNPQGIQASKRRFIDNVWLAQALYRTREGRSVALQSGDVEVESRQGRTTLARTYFNVYQRKAFLAGLASPAPPQPKVVLHVDQSGTADPIPIGARGGPFVVIRVQPIDADRCRFTVSTRRPRLDRESPDEDEEEEETVSTVTLPEKVVQTIHTYGLFKFETDNQSRPGTPTAASTRSRKFGLDALTRSRKFNTSSSRGRALSSSDVFSTGTTNSHYRSRSATSSSNRTQTDSLLKSSHRSDSTGVTTPDEDGLNKSLSAAGRTPQASPRRKLIKRGKSPGPSGASGSETESPRRGSRPPSRAGDVEKELPPVLTRKDMDASEWDLTRRLELASELARQNSLNQHGTGPVKRETRETPVEETIYEEEPPQPFIMQTRRPVTPSRGSGSTHSSPTRSIYASPTRTTPRGPRSPSTKSAKSPRSPTSDESMDLDVERALERTLTQISHDLKSSPPPSTPRRKRLLAELEDEMDMEESPTKRQPFANTENIMLDFALTPTKSPCVVEPLSIKKKQVTSMHASPTTNTARRMQSMVAQHGNTKGSPKSSAAPSRGLSLDRGRPTRTVFTSGGPDRDVADRLLIVAETTKEDIQSSRRAIKRIKLELETREAGKPTSSSTSTGAASTGFPHSPRSRHISAQASARVAELRQMIEQRAAAGGGRAGTPDREVAAPSTSSEEWASAVENLTAEAERKLKKAASGHEALQDDLRQLVAAFKEKAQEAEKAQAELQKTKAQCELVKNLLKDVTEEKEIMYEAFNKELDGMYNDANLPETEAWDALTRDLRAAKDARNTLEKDNAKLKQELAEAKLLRDQSVELLRLHNLIS